MKIFYGICGEGMGHAGRSLALIERLSALGHRVTIFTFADGLRLLGSAGYEPVAIDGLQFRVAADGGVDHQFAVFTVTGNPDLTPVNREFIAGWSCALIEMTGAKLVTVEKSEPRPKVWAWRFTWK